MAKKPAGGKAALEQVLERLAALEERIARLEGENHVAVAAAADFDVVVPAPAVEAMPAAARQPAAAAGTQPGMGAAASQPAEEISEEILLVLSAAVAAFLGERAHVKQVRLLHSDAWAQQGRVSVMASHRWAVHR